MAVIGTIPAQYQIEVAIAPNGELRISQVVDGEENCIYISAPNIPLLRSLLCFVNTPDPEGQEACPRDCSR